MPFGFLIARTAGFILRIKVPVGSRSLGGRVPKTKSVLTLLGGGSQTLSDRGIRKPRKIWKIVDNLAGVPFHLGDNIRVGGRLHTLVSRVAI